MDSAEFIGDFTEWIKHHTPIESFYVNDRGSELIFYALTSEKSTFLFNSMIFTEYDYTSYCKLNNIDENPHVEIEFLSGNKATIELISPDFTPGPEIKKLFSR